MDDAAASMATALPWTTDLRSLIAEAATCEDAAGCLFAIEDDIPPRARGGYAALVVAYTRDGEPVVIFDDGAALLLIKTGGVASARLAAERIIGQMRRLGLDETIRVGIAGVDDLPDTLAERARAAATHARPGAISG